MSGASRTIAPLAVLCLFACQSPSAPSDARSDRDATKIVDGALDAPQKTDLRPDAPQLADARLPDQNTCQFPPPPQADPWSLRHPSAGFGGITTEKSGVHTDVFLKSPKGTARIGARLNWGGTVVFFGLSNDKNSNVIDANDTGRELQIALYDPTRRHQPCAGKGTCSGSTQKVCGASITYLGWNPVQGGDECGHGAAVRSHKRVGDALRLEIQPIQWNPDWDAPDCRKSACPKNGVPVAVTYTMELRFVSEHVVEVMTQVSSQEKISHPTTDQEWPTLYVSHGKGGPDLPLLIDAAAKTIAINTPANDNFFVQNFSSSRPWVAFQNTKKTYGVGLGMDQGLTGFQGWRGDGNNAPYFHNVRSVVRFGLNAGAVVRGISYLALGSYATVKADLEAVFRKRPPFGTLDVPAAGPVSVKANTPISFSGWVLDSTPIAEVELHLDGKLLRKASVNGSRPDVCAVYPGYAGCAAKKVGFSLPIALSGLDPKCAHRLEVFAKDSEGNRSLLGARKLIPSS